MLLNDMACPLQHHTLHHLSAILMHNALMPSRTCTVARYRRASSAPPGPVRRHAGVSAAPPRPRLKQHPRAHWLQDQILGGHGRRRMVCLDVPASASTPQQQQHPSPSRCSAPQSPSPHLHRLPPRTARRRHLHCRHRGQPLPDIGFPLRHPPV